MSLVERFKEKSKIIASSGALAVLFSSGCTTPEGTWAMGGIAGGNALYNSSLSPQAAAGLGLASALLQSGAVLQQGKQTQEMINQQKTYTTSPSNTPVEELASDPFIKVLRLPDVGKVEITYYIDAVDKNGNGIDYPEEYIGLRPANNARFPLGQKFNIEYNAEDKRFQKFLIKIYDGKGDTITDIDTGRVNPRNGSVIAVGQIEVGKFKAVMYGLEEDRRITIRYDPPKPFFSFGGRQKTYSPPPPQPEPRVLFLGEAPFEVYENK